MDAPRGFCGTSVLPLKPGQPQAMYEKDNCDVHFYGDDQLLDGPERTDSEERYMFLSHTYSYLLLRFFRSTKNSGYSVLP